MSLLDNDTLTQPLWTPPRCALLALLALSAGCGDDAVCGADAENPTTIAASINAESVQWENWRSSPNNDCGEMGGPISLTVEADQVATGRGLTLCLPRPDRLSASTIDLADESRIRVVDVFADAGGVNCLASLDRSADLVGTVAFPGICDGGQHPDGYSIVFDIGVPMTVTCDQATRSETMTISATVAVRSGL